MQRRIAYLSMDDLSNFCTYDTLTVPAMESMGFLVEQVPWRDASRDWRAYEAVVIRSTWDYQDDPDAFLAVLAEIEAAGVPLANSVEVCRWNLRKRYLQELSQAGVRVVPTVFHESASPDQFIRSVEAARSSFCTDRLIVKPEVSANADDTYRVVFSPQGASRALVADHDETSLHEVAGRFVSRPYLLQPMVPSVVTEGEYSLFFFAGTYSHAIVKRPAPGDFRVQEEHDGRIAAFDANVQMREQGARILKAAEQVTGEATLLYARVDLVRGADGRLDLMELELIEPSLYFNLDDRASERFAVALDRWLAERPAGSPAMR